MSMHPWTEDDTMWGNKKKTACLRSAPRLGTEGGSSGVWAAVLAWWGSERGRTGPKAFSYPQHPVGLSPNPSKPEMRFLVHVHMHVRTHECTHARMHVRMHVRTHAHMYARTYARTHARTHARAHTPWSAIHSSLCPTPWARHTRDTDNQDSDMRSVPKVTLRGCSPHGQRGKRARREEGTRLRSHSKTVGGGT